jgi:CBS-domain-containing membrane protein
MTTTSPHRNKLRFPLEQATVADAMTTGVINCAPETPLRNVAGLMTENHVHAVYVFDYGDEDDETVELWGLVSDLDLVAACPVIDERTAGNSSVTPLVTVRSDEPLDHAAQLMAENSTAHLAVLDPVTRRPVGVLSTLDVARALAAEMRAPHSAGGAYGCAEPASRRA